MRGNRNEIALASYQLNTGLRCRNTHTRITNIRVLPSSAYILYASLPENCKYITGVWAVNSRNTEKCSDEGRGKVGRNGGLDKAI